MKDVGSGGHGEDDSGRHPTRELPSILGARVAFCELRHNFRRPHTQRSRGMPSELASFPHEAHPLGSIEAVLSPEHGLASFSSAGGRVGHFTPRIRHSTTNRLGTT